MATPQGWQPGDKLIVHNSLKTDDAKKHFEGKEVEEVFVSSCSRLLSCSSVGRLEALDVRQLAQLSLPSTPPRLASSSSPVVLRLALRSPPSAELLD